MAKSMPPASVPPAPTGPSELKAALDHLRDPRVLAGVTLGSEVRRSMSEFLHARGFVEIPSVLVAPVTDPLNHPVYDARVDYYGHDFQLTRSMIFHKQLATLSFEKVFCFSPNLRFEPLDRKDTGRHLAEFTQLDLEVRDARREEVMTLAEEMLVHVVGSVRRRQGAILRALLRSLPQLAPPFPRISYTEAREKHGDSFEAILSQREPQPFWIVDIPLADREFYDREDPERPGLLLDMDLIYPEGYGEAISGGEREYELAQILRRIEKKGQDPEQFRWYVEAVKSGLPPSSGFGIGIERLCRWLGGLKGVDQTTLFPKRIGQWSL